MRAFAVTSWNAEPGLTNLPAPKPAADEVLVRVRGAALNGLDMAVAAGMFRGIMGDFLPIVLGKDFAGVVEAVGPQVTRFAVGDPVCGVITYPSAFDTSSLADYLAVPETSAIVRIPEGVAFDEAGAFGLAGATALRSVEAIAPRAGEVVLVSGATGGVGSFAIQLAAATGATVIATARSGDDAAFVTGLGAAHAVDLTGNLAAQVRTIAPNGVDAVIHLAGDAQALGGLLRPGGRLSSSIGAMPDQFRGQNIMVFPVMANANADALDRLATGIAAGDLRVAIQRTYPLAETGAAIAAFRAGARGKLAIAID